MTIEPSTEPPPDKPPTEFEASFAPSRFALAIAGGAALAAVAACVWLVSLSLRVALSTPLPGDEWRQFLLGGLAMSAAPLLVVAVQIWGARLHLGRVWLRATPGRVEWERVWWGVRRFDVFEAKPGVGLLDCDGAWFRPDGKSFVSVVSNGKTILLTRPVTGERAAPIRAALAAAIGTVPAGRPAGPWLKPADPQAVAHPAVAVGRDRRGRGTVTTPLWSARPFRRVSYAVIGAALAAAVPLLWAVLPDSAPGTRAADVILGTVGTLAGGIVGLTVAAAPWATVRVTIGPRRLVVRTGWGPVRWGRGVSISSVRAAVVAAHHTGVWGAVNGGDGSPAGAPWRAIVRNPVAAVIRPVRSWDRWVSVTRTFLPLTGRLGGDDPADRVAFAAAAAGAVAAGLRETGWEPDVPDDWRFAPPAPLAPNIPA